MSGLAFEQRLLLLIDPAPDRRAGSQERDADAEIIESAELLTVVTGQPVSLVTGDVSMRLRAKVKGLPAIPMPDSLLATLEDRQSHDA